MFSCSHRFIFIQHWNESVVNVFTLNKIYSFQVVKVNISSKTIVLDKGSKVRYNKLLIATGEE